MIIRNFSRYLLSSLKSLPIPPQISSKTDFYRSIHLTVNSKIPQTQFNSYMNSLITTQIQNNKKLNQDKQTNAIWVHLNAQEFGLAGWLCKNGFIIHHAIDNKMSVYKWIASKKDLVTPYSTIYMSAGALLVKDQKVFLVQERNGPRKGHFGIPGGRSDFGQTISACSQRQLVQQTNIKAKFKYILHFRQLQKTAFGAMDIYFACLMQHNNQSFNDIKLCQRQLRSYKWVHLSEYQQFCKKNSVGTQYQLARYVTKLYNNGFDFNGTMLNQTIFQNYTSPVDKIQRLAVQHGLVQGISIDKTYL